MDDDEVGTAEFKASTKILASDDHECDGEYSRVGAFAVSIMCNRICLVEWEGEGK